MTTRQAPPLYQVELDVVALIDDLNRWGWRDQKIETVLDFSAGYVAKLRAGPRPERPYQLAVRLYNFWVTEGVKVGEFAEWQTLSETSTG